MDGFKFVEVGNTYSEYKCEQCGKNIVINMEDLDHVVLEHHRIFNCSLHDAMTPASGDDEHG